MGRRSKKTFLQRRHIDGQKVCEKMLNITIREMKIKTAMRYHLILVKVASIKSIQTNAGEYMEKRDPFYTADGNVN